jgi:hypothetical protein
MLPDVTPDDGIWVIDTGDLFAALEGEPGANKRGLERICRHLQIPTEWLHNAGNDAHVCIHLDDLKRKYLHFHCSTLYWP